MNRFEKAKAHFKQHKTAYLVGLGGLTVGIVGGTVFGRSKLVNATITQVLSYKPTASIDVYIEALGDPGNIIQDVTTGTVYASQGQAARELGVAASRISNHLAGRSPHVEGHKFVKLGKALVSEDHQ